LVYICKVKKSSTYSKSEKTKQFIIEQVAPIFNKKGYAGTSLSDLTEATGLTKGSIYGNFKNKNEVAIEAFKYNLSLSTQTFFNAISNKSFSPIDKLLSFPQSYEKRYDSVIAMGGCPILNTASDTDDTHPQLKKLAQDAILRIENALVSVLKEGIKQKQIKQDVDPNKIAGVMISLIEGGFMMAKLLDNKVYFNNSFKQVEEFINEIKQ